MDKVKYVNHLGETLDLRSTSIMSSYLALKNFVQSMTNNGLTSEGKSVALPVVCLTKKDANRLIDTLEKDSTQNIYGKFYVNDWYIRVIYQGMTIIGEYGDKVKMEISFYADETIFTKETRYTLQASPETSGKGFEFPFTYPFTFSTDAVASTKLTNNEIRDADFELQIEAEIESVNIVIGKNQYIVNAPINAGELFVLNTAEKEVYKTKNGVKTNLLGATDDNYYIFEPLKQGNSTVSWSGQYVIVVTLFEHRRSPVWI